MPLLNQVRDQQAFSVHLLLCGRSKTGKTKYIADMLKLGFMVFYVDNDNGAATLIRDTKDSPEAMQRCYYVRTENLWEFTQTFFARIIHQWNMTQDCIYEKGKASPDDVIMTINRNKIPSGVVFVFDSWTSLCIQLINKASGGVDAEAARLDQDIYGSMNRSANTVGMNIQSFPHHVVYLAHTDYYERRESPPGLAKEMAKQANQIIKENVEIPWSVSRPHGYSIPKFFTDIGYMGIDNIGNFTLDFRQSKDRVGAGSPRKIGDPTKDLRFDNAFFEGKVPVVSQPFADWVIEEPASVILARLEAEAEEKRLKAEEAKAAKAAANPAPVAAAKPGLSLPGKSLLGK
jgi:hypothetical protein